MHDFDPGCLSIGVVGLGKAREAPLTMRLATIFRVAWSGSGRGGLHAALRHYQLFKTSLRGVNLAFRKPEIKVASEGSEPVSQQG